MATYADGVTIKVNGSPVEIASAERQADHSVVHYVLDTPVSAGDTVTWEYSAASGAYVAEAGAGALADVAAQTVTNNVSGGSDPIGEALRATCVAYYTGNEAAGNVRLDSTSSNYDLVECADGNPETPASASVASVAGKVGNAIRIFDSTSSINQLGNNAININIGTSDALTIACWLRVNALTGGNQSITNNQSFDSVNLYTANFDMLRGPVVAARPDSTLYAITYWGYETLAALEDAGNHSVNINADEWFFCVADYYFADHYMKFSVNGSEFYTLNIASWSTIFNADSPFTSVQLGAANYVSDTDQIDIDELGIYLNHFTADDVAYLYNSGAGRALFPAP